MPRRTVPLLWLAIAAVLAAGVGGAATRSDDGEEASPPSFPPPTSAAAAPTTTTTVALDIESVVPVLQAFVERERGLAFERPVDVALLADAPFEARLRETEEEDMDEVRDAENVLQAMGLLDRAVDLVATVRELTAAAVLGFYDSETEELVVRGSRPTPFVRTVLVHELTHALEDQHFDLDRPDLGDEAFLGFQALVEGSAIRIEDRYRESLAGAERRALAREERRSAVGLPADVPRAVEALFGFPYVYGPDVVEAAVEAGGQRALDGAFADPPASTEHVLHPRRWLDGDEAREVPVPRADGPAFDDGEIGELFLALMLDAELGGRDAREAAEGWGGDRYVAWQDGELTCIRVDIVMDTAADTAELGEALGEWAAERPGRATVSGTSLRTCG